MLDKLPCNVIHAREKRQNNHEINIRFLTLQLPLCGYDSFISILPRFFLVETRCMLFNDDNIIHKSLTHNAHVIKTSRQFFSK